MSTHVQNILLKVLPLSFLLTSVTAFLFMGTAFSAENLSAGDSASGLRIAFQDAAHDARIGDDLNPAYELLGIAESAQQQNLPQIAAQAATAFADLVKRVTTKALKTGGSMIEDTLDQFVDLRFMARTANLPLPQAALDEAMASLFPPVSASVQHKIDTAAPWPDKLKFAEDLAGLQASATQILKEDVALSLGAAFDLKTAQLEALANGEPDMDARKNMLNELANARKSRDDRLVDARANNINVVAALMKNQGGESGTPPTTP